MDEEQRFAFDTWGFLTVEDAITPEQVADLKATVDAKGPELHSQHADRGGFWSQAFVDLLDVPVISKILAEIYGGQRAGGLPPSALTTSTSTRTAPSTKISPGGSSTAATAAC